MLKFFAAGSRLCHPAPDNHAARQGSPVHTAASRHAAETPGVSPSVSGIPVLALALMLAFPKLSVRGAADGLDLWFHVVLPTLAPFMICTQAIVASGGVGILMKPLHPLLDSLFGLSLPGSYIMLCGLLCGYPLGAKLCADFLRDGMISREEAEYLLAICNHPSPMFLLGYVSSQLPQKTPALLLFLCLYLPILPISRIAGKYTRFRRHNEPDAPSCRSANGRIPGAARRSLEDILMSASETMVMIGGYMMLFSILSAWVRHIPGLPGSLQAMITGLAEITTGVRQICISFPADTCLIPCIAAIAFGGLSGIFQTGGVIKRSGLSVCHYAAWKVLHAGMSVIVFLFLRLFFVSIHAR